MRRLMRHTVTAIVITFSGLVVTPADLAAQADVQAAPQPMIRRPIPEGGRHGSLNFIRTELFFGTAKPDGVVSDAEFLAFLDQEVTPRFPDGLTLLKGDGQFRGEDGVIIKEDSFLLILLYPVESFRQSNRRINTIRELYKAQFQQQSVLRVDDPFAVRVSF